MGEGASIAFPFGFVWSFFLSPIHPSLFPLPSYLPPPPSYLRFQFCTDITLETDKLIYNEQWKRGGGEEENTDMKSLFSFTENFGFK